MVLLVCYRKGVYLHGAFQIRGDENINKRLRDACNGNFNLKKAENLLQLIMCQPLTNVILEEQGDSGKPVSTELANFVDFIVEAINKPLKTTIPRPEVSKDDPVQERIWEFFPDNEVKR